MVRKTFMIISLVLLLMISPALAQVCDPAGFMGTGEVNQNVTLTQTCPTCTFLNITIKDPNLGIVLSNVAMVEVGGTFEFVYSNTALVGTYFVEGHSNLPEPFVSCFEITKSGFSQDTLWFNFILLFFMAGSAVGMIYKFNESREATNEQGLNSLYYYLGAFLLFAVGSIVIIEGFGGYQTLITDSFGYLTWGSALFFMTKPWFIGGRWKW